MKRRKKTLLSYLTLITCLSAAGQQSETAVRITPEQQGQQSRVPVPHTARTSLTLGGYGEAALQRMYYSDNVYRYDYPETYKNRKHGRFDLPHVVFYAAYNFGRGWKVSSEIEFEHGGAGAAVEIEREEGGEYESEIEKGGEVVIEQFWIEKTWSKPANLRIGHIIVPVGLVNQHHMPVEFFQVRRPEEAYILPCTWHETGADFWGNVSKWRYEIQLLAGLDAERFDNANWIAGGSVSPYEFSIANNFAFAFRIDNSSVKGLNIGLSGYNGRSAGNSLRQERYEGIEGAVSIGAVDAVYNNNRLIFRGNVIYGHLSDSYLISGVNKKMPSASPSARTDVASDAMSWYVEAGYDMLSFFTNRKYNKDKLYLYGHYGYVNSMYKTAAEIIPKDWCEKNIVSAGLNYFPVPEVVVKAEYSIRKFRAYDNEPAVSFGIGYAGLFR